MSFSIKLFKPKTETIVLGINMAAQLGLMTYLNMTMGSSTSESREGNKKRENANQGPATTGITSQGCKLR